MKKRRICLLLALLCLLSGCRKRVTVPQGQADRLIYNMVTDYGNTQSNQAVDKALEELRQADPQKAELWTKIMDYWRYTAESMELSYDALPAGLPEDDTLCLAALGFELDSDGTIKPELETRLRTLLTCAQQYPNAIILCTGGGTAANNKSVTEAGQMAAWLQEQGVKPERILVEDRSRSTAQNAIYSFALLQEQAPQVNTVAIVSSDYHCGWGSVLFEAQFLISGGDIHVAANAACSIPDHAEYGFAIQGRQILEVAGLR